MTPKDTKPRVAKWEREAGYVFFCSACEWPAPVKTVRDGRTFRRLQYTPSHCPECGAKMTGGIDK